MKEVVVKKVTWRSPQAWKPIIILFILFTLQQFSGVYIVVFYTIQILENAFSVEIDPFMNLVLIGLIRFLMALLSVFLSKRFGRKPLLATSGLGMALVILVAAGHIHFAGQGMIPGICILLYVFFGSFGVSVIPWTLIGELLPLSVRGKGSGFLIAIAYIHMFVTVKLFIVVLDNIGIVSVFLIFSVCSFLLVIFVYFKIPETLGKTLQEIENYFK